ncbi:O-antigen ligase family protein [Streptococcus acidominimus]|uniref:Lipid A core - O-antigen ligase and related enzymes n=1 Tax=Streptococcus acidominimus TaxID=1326 RepID=A0A1Q8EDG3_STRAI|nr:O-antigen ligase family protein [Streptococcus acidominimus]OLF49822.1 hypothetical protein BU200_05225 [Streptococcus acidominimus]SUN08161.1 Lipid A core - O-antigen ligase and related enzymes [Streptococcus acidominimus]
MKYWMNRSLYLSWIVTLALSLNMVGLIAARTKFFHLGAYYLFLLLAVVVAALYIAVNHFKFDLKRSDLVLYSLPLLMVLLSAATRPYDVDALKAYGLILVTLLLVTAVSFSKEQVEWLTKSYLLSALIFSVVMLVQRRLPYEEYNLLRYGIFFDDQQFYDINFTAAYLIIPNLIALYRFLEGQKIYLLVWIMISIPIIMTGSRGAVVPIILVLLYKLITKKGITFKQLLIFIGILLLSLFFIPNELRERFFAKSYMTDGSNIRRFSEWRLGFEIFLEKPILGQGMVAPIRLLSKFEQGMTAHNSFLVYLIHFGIVGTIAFIGQLLQIFSRLLKVSKDYIGMIFAFVFSMILIEANTSLIFIIPLIYFVIVGKADTSIRQGKLEHSE